MLNTTDHQGNAIKTIVRHHLTPVRMAVIKTRSHKYWWGCGERGTLMHCWDYKLLLPLWKVVWRFLKKLKTKLPSDVAITLVGIYPKKKKTLTWEDTCSFVYTAALPTVAKARRHRQMNGWHMCAVDCYSAIKKKGVLPWATVWWALLSEVSQRKTNTIWCHWNLKTHTQTELIGTENRSVVARGGGGQNELKIRPGDAMYILHGDYSYKLLHIWKLLREYLTNKNHILKFRVANTVCIS